jgi:hypothetical protein
MGYAPLRLLTRRITHVPPFVFDHTNLRLVYVEGLY